MWVSPHPCFSSNPQDGRFLSQDPFGGDSNDPISLHRYLYASDDPVNMVDPGGQEDFSLGGFAVAMGIDATIEGAMLSQPGTIQELGFVAKLYDLQITPDYSFLPQLPTPSSLPKPLRMGLDAALLGAGIFFSAIQGPVALSTDLTAGLLSGTAAFLGDCAVYSVKITLEKQYNYSLDLTTWGEYWDEEGDHGLTNGQSAAFDALDALAAGCATGAIPGGAEWKTFEKTAAILVPVGQDLLKAYEDHTLTEASTWEAIGSDVVFSFLIDKIPDANEKEEEALKQSVAELQRNDALRYKLEGIALQFVPNAIAGAVKTVLGG